MFIALALVAIVGVALYTKVQCRKNTNRVVSGRGEATVFGEARIADYALSAQCHKNTNRVVSGRGEATVFGEARMP